MNDSPEGAAAPRRRRPAVFLGALALPLVLGGCQVPAFWGYRGSTSQAHDEFNLWAGTFIAAIVVGAITAALIIWAMVAYRRRTDDMPRQFQYHLPLEITYTIVPIVIVLVLFAFTFIDENKVDALAPNPPVVVNVYAFQWGWQFNYSGTDVRVQAETTTDPDPVGPAGVNGPNCAPAPDCLGPGLIVPAGQTVQINLRSKDTIHGFYVPQFNFSRYAQPGVLNQFDLTVNKAGVYRAQCTQYCGLYHSLMLFHVVAMPPAEFQAWLASQPSSSSQSSGSSANSSSSNY